MGTNKTILVVDDSIIARMLLARHFQEKHKDWTVLEAENTEEALKILQDKRCDVISIDYNMPGENGLNLIHQIQATYPKMKIAMLTANIQDSLRIEVEDLGVVFLEKPITTKTIERLIEL